MEMVASSHHCVWGFEEAEEWHAHCQLSLGFALCTSVGQLLSLASPTLVCTSYISHLIYSSLGFLPSFFEIWKTSLEELSSKGLLQKEKGDHSLGWILSRFVLILQLLPSWIATKGVSYMATTLKIGSLGAWKTLSGWVEFSRVALIKELSISGYASVVNSVQKPRE